MHAQRLTEDTLALFYDYNHELRIKLIEREHIPLHGDSVTMIPFRKDAMFGFVDKTSSKWLIKPCYEQVFAVYKEGAIVKSENGYGLVNQTGKSIIPLQFDNLVKEAGIYRGSLFGIIDTTIKNELYRSNILSMFFNEKGQFLFEENAHDFAVFQERDSITWFRFGTKFHIRSKSGSLKKIFNHDFQNTFLGIHNNLLLFRYIRNNQNYYRAESIDGIIQFELPVDQPADGVYRLANNLFGFFVEEGDYFFSDSTGALKPYGISSGSVGFIRFSGKYFEQDYFVVKDFQSDKYGLINRSGETILPFEFNHLVKTGEDTYLANRRQFVNHTGDTLFSLNNSVAQQTLEHYFLLNEPIEIPFDRLLLKSPWKQQDVHEKKLRHSMHGNLDEATFYYVNLKGDTVLMLPSSTIFASNFHEGLALIMDTSQKAGFINWEGKWVIPPQYELSMAGSYPLPYLVVPKFQGGFAYIKSFKGYIDNKGKQYFSGKRLQDHYDFSH